MAEATNFVFGVQLVHSKYYAKKCKITSKGLDMGHVTYLTLIFGTQISLERLKLQTWNLLCCLLSGSTMQKCNIGSKRH